MADERISSKLRTAIRLRARQGIPIAEACERAGCSESGWHKAMKRGHVQAFLADELAVAAAEIDDMRLSARRVALESALDLMKNAKSETVRARMVEFLAGEGKVASAVTVNVDARSQGGSYEYPPRGARVVAFVMDHDPEPVMPLPDDYHPDDDASGPVDAARRGGGAIVR